MLPKLPILNYLICCLLLCTACNKASNEPYDKVAAFEDLWSSFNRYSASIDARNLDWSGLRAQYLPLVNNDMSATAYFELMSQFLLAIRDPHVHLISPTRAMYTIDYLNYRRNINFNLTEQNYLQSVERHSASIVSATINDSIAYLYASDFKGDRETVAAIYKEIIQKQQSKKALIIDLRENDGGSVYNAQSLLNRIAPERKLWHTTENKTLGGFDEKFNWYFEPTTPSFKNKKIIVLIGRYTISAGERFSIGANLLDHVTTLGDTTANTQGSVMGREMLNGWKYTLTFERCLAPDGTNYGGVGIAPDIYVPTLSLDLNTEDALLEKAIELVE